MVRWIVSSSMRFKLLILAAAAALIAVGVVRLPETHKDVLPEFAPPYVEVQTEALGLSASEVEELVSVNLEELLNGTPWLDSIRSTSVPGLSSVVLTFKPGTDVARARQLVAERLTLAYALPNVSRPPVILQPLSASSRLLMISLSSRRVSPIQMSVLTRWTIRPALLSVPGVANVTVWGYRDRQLQVRVDPKRLASDGIPLDQIVRTSGNAMWVSPLTYLEASTPGAGGWIETPQQRLEVRHVFPISGPGGLAEVRVEDDSRALGSVARVVEDHPPLIGDAVLRGGTPGLLLVVEKLPGADTLEVTRGVEAALHRLGAGLAGITTDTTIFRPATYVNASTDHLRLALIIGAILVLGVLLAFLYDWRGVLVAVVSIGLSLLAAALLMDALGYTMNAMVVGGLVIALAVVADEAIVSVDGLLRRLRERGDGRGASAATAILEGVARARPIAVYATLIILLPLLPALFLTGVSGSLFTPLAVAYALGVAVAAALTVTLTPALAAALFPRGTRSRTSPLVPWVTRAYAAALGRVIARPGPALGVAVAAVAAGAAVIPFLGRAQLPAFSDTNVIVRFDAAAGTSQPEMARITARLGTELRAIPGVERVAGQIGRAVLGDRIVDVNSSQLFVRIGPDADYDATLSKVRTVVDGYPGLARDVQTYETQSLHRVGTQSKDPLVVKVFGPNYTLLRAQAERVGQALAGIDGVGAVHVERSVQQPHIDITVRLNDAQRYGLKPGDVRREAATLLAGLSVGSLFEQQKVFDVAVWTNPGTRRSLSDVTRLLLDTPSGGHVQLGKVADVRITPSPVIIRRESVSRRVEVGLAVSGRSAGDVAGDVRSRLARMTWPPEYHAELTGEAVEGHGSRNRMIGAGVVAAILAFLLMQAAFRSWRLAAALFLALPLALVGGVLAAFVADDTVTLGSLLAFLAVLALAVRNGMALVDHYRHLEEEEGVPFGPDLVLRGARERVVPIITTALAVALAMLPLVITGAIAGQEVANPIAVIVLGGVFTSTALSLFVIPALYLRFGSRAVDLATPDLDLQPR